MDKLNSSYIYKFDGFRLDAEEGKLFRGDEQLQLQPKAIQVLLLLVANAGRIVWNEEILKEVWQESSVEEGGINTRIRSIRRALGQDKDKIFIKTENKAFKFVMPVTRVEKQQPTLVTNEENVGGSQPESGSQNATQTHRAAAEISETIDVTTPPQSSKSRIIAGVFSVTVVATVLIYIGINFKICVGACREQNIYAFLTAVAYGILVGVGVLLECAYDFDKYGWNAAKVIPPIVLANFGAMLSALTIAGNNLPRGIGYAFGTGICFLIGGAILSCVLSSLVLPNLPITAARFQTQPALIAFCKNCFIYFFPIYSIFSLLVFCFLYSTSPATRNKMFPIGFAVLLLLLSCFSYLSTNYLSDNLLTARDREKYTYHGLFSSLLFFRFIFCFGPPFGSVVWYFIHSATSN